VSVGALYDSPFDQYHSGGPDELFGKECEKAFDFVKSANALAFAAQKGKYA
jgi:hypothetical protein